MSKYLRIGVSVVLLAFIGWKTDWANVGDKFAHLNVVYWLGAVVALVLAQFVSARRWQLFARELRFERTLGQYSAYYFIGMYFNLLLPTSVGGDVMRVWYLNGESGRKMAALASVFLERVNGLLVLIAMLALLVSARRPGPRASACRCAEMPRRAAIDGPGQAVCFPQKCCLWATACGRSANARSMGYHHHKGRAHRPKHGKPRATLPPARAVVYESNQRNVPIVPGVNWRCGW